MASEALPHPGDDLSATDPAAGQASAGADAADGVSAVSDEVGGGSDVGEGAGEAPAPVPYAAPRAGLEEMLAGIWGEVLGVERVGANDNFFDLGGRSVLLVQIHERVKEAMGRDVPMVAFFKHPTVRALADYLAAEPADEGEDEETTRTGQTRADSRRELRSRRRDRRG
jgi:aryl carrier-like protein